MIDRRLVAGFGLISLPVISATIATILVCGKFLRDYETQTGEREVAFRREVYRQTAEELQLHPERGIVPEIPKDHGRMRYMRPGRWGYVERADGVEIWYLHDRRAQSVMIDLIPSVGVSSMIWPTVVFALVLFWSVTIFGCWLFRRMLAERDDFVAATAHDLKTPLVAIRRLIGREDEEAKVISERMLRLVQNLNDFLNAGGKRSPSVTNFDLRATIMRSYALFADDFRWLADGKDLEITGLETCEVNADEAMTEQILWNLFGNELKYAAPHGKVSVRLEESDEEARVIFTDEGPGLSAHDSKRIFRRYYRARRILKSGKGGFGIGLCTAREFARAMGGELEVSANEPTGCVFVLTLRKR